MNLQICPHEYMPHKYMQCMISLFVHLLSMHASFISMCTPVSLQVWAAHQPLDHTF